MKLDILAPHIPPSATQEEALKIIADWARDTTEKLNMILGSIDEDNLSGNLKERINHGN